MRRRRRAAGAVVLALLTAPVPTRSSAGTEYAIKAAFLLNFAKFVEWPADALAQGEPLLVAVVGEGVPADLEGGLKGKVVNGHRLDVIPVRDGPELPRCHVAFVLAEAEKRLRPALQAAAGKPVLTMTEIAGGRRSDAVINFVAVETRMGFEVNLESAERQGLQVSARLLGLAATVHGRARAAS